jgi:hypothetical protein
MYLLNSHCYVPIECDEPIFVHIGLVTKPLTDAKEKEKNWLTKQNGYAFHSVFSLSFHFKTANLNIFLYDYILLYCKRYNQVFQN